MWISVQKLAEQKGFNAMKANTFAMNNMVRFSMCYMDDKAFHGDEPHIHSNHVADFVDSFKKVIEEENRALYS